MYVCSRVKRTITVLDPERILTLVLSITSYACFRSSLVRRKLLQKIILTQLFLSHIALLNVSFSTKNANRGVIYSRCNIKSCELLIGVAITQTP